MSRESSLSDARWARIEPLMPSSNGQRGRPFREHRQVLEGIIYRFRTQVAWHDLPESFGPWQAVWKRHRRFSADDTYDNDADRGRNVVERSVNQLKQWRGPATRYD